MSGSHALTDNVLARFGELESCRVRRGIAADDGTVRRPWAEGVTDFGRAWTLVQCDPVNDSDESSAKAARFAATAREGGGGIGGMLRNVLSVEQTLMYYGGVVFTQLPDGRFWTRETPVDGAARHPNDPVWLVDALYGAVEMVEDLVTTPVAGDSEERLSGILDLKVANGRSPHGVRQPLPGGRFSRNTRLPCRIWLTAGQRARRISIGLPGRTRLWISAEFWDFGVNISRKRSWSVANVARVQ